MLVVETMVQVPDISAEVMSVQAFKRDLSLGGASRLRPAVFTARLIMPSLSTTQTLSAASLRLRAGRVGPDEFKLSHEFLAMMPGAIRPTISLVAGNLQKLGLIKSMHRRITISDRPS